MAGKIKADLWVPFRAEQEIDGRSFAWRARVGVGPLTLARIADSYAHGVGSSGGAAVRSPAAVRLGRRGHRALGRRPRRAGERGLRRAQRAARTRRGLACGERQHHRGALQPSTRAPRGGGRIDSQGAIQRVSAARWGPRGDDRYEYIPCGCEVHEERRFGHLTIPSRLTVSWQFGTPRQAPFFKAAITAAEALA